MCNNEWESHGSNFLWRRQAQAQAQTNPHLKNLEKKVFKTKTKGLTLEKQRIKQHEFELA
jgi:hypothetical protein